MDRPFVPVATPEAVEELFLQSAEQPVIVFKHDTSCPISKAAYGQMQHMTQNVMVVDVAQSKELSADIAARTGIKHESPQVIVVRNGKAVWSASHYDITQEAVEQGGVPSREPSA